VMNFRKATLATKQKDQDSVAKWSLAAMTVLCNASLILLSERQDCFMNLSLDT
jgi:hypothetical protein